MNTRLSKLITSVKRKFVLNGFYYTLLLRYDIQVSGKEYITNKKGILVLPNHAATVDPIIIFTQFKDTLLQPLVDEAYFKNIVFKDVLSLFDAIEVPDIRKNRSGITQIRQLDAITHDSLVNKKNVIFYPSGHITLDGKEHIGGRSLAYDTCKNLPEDIEVIGIKIDGLWGSMWSRYGRKSTPSFAINLLKSIGLILCGWVFIKKRRIVKIKVEPITENVKKWAQSLEKKEFNEKLEAYYNN